MKVSEAKKLIGKRIMWRECFGYRGDIIRSGVLEEVQGRNVVIDGDWKWLPDLTGAEEDKRAGKGEE